MVSLKLLKSKHIYNFYRIKEEEEEENHRNKKEITTKFDEEPKIRFSGAGLILKNRTSYLQL